MENTKENQLELQKFERKMDILQVTTTLTSITVG